MQRELLDDLMLRKGLSAFYGESTQRVLSAGRSPDGNIHGLGRRTRQRRGGLQKLDCGIGVTAVEEILPDAPHQLLQSFPATGATISSSPSFFERSLGEHMDTGLQGGNYRFLRLKS